MHSYHLGGKEIELAWRLLKNKMSVGLATRKDIHGKMSVGLCA